MTDSEKERVRLAELDLEKTNDFVKGVLSTGAALRGSAVTIWLALIGFAIQQGLAELAWLAALVASVFLLLDGYHGWLYSEAAKHANALERLLSTYYDSLSRGQDDEDALIDFRTELRFHRFGLFLNLRHQFRLRDVWSARPRLFYRGLYPVLVAIALLVGGLVAGGAIGASSSTPTEAQTDCAAYFVSLDQLADDEPAIGSKWPAQALDSTAKRCGLTSTAKLDALLAYLAKR